LCVNNKMHNCVHTIFYIVIILLSLRFIFSLNIIDNFFNVVHAPVSRSLGEPERLAELNGTSWTPDCFPHGEYYVARYSLPRKNL
jgi:hypothetical protein